MTVDYITVAVAGIFILLGAVFLVAEVVGIYRFGYSLSRMHAAALGDTSGLLFTLLGLIILNGAQSSSLKLAAIIVIFWITSPISGHILARLVFNTDSEVYTACDVQDSNKNGEA